MNSLSWWMCGYYLLRQQAGRLMPGYCLLQCREEEVKHKPLTPTHRHTCTYKGTNQNICTHKQMQICAYVHKWINTITHMNDLPQTKFGYLYCITWKSHNLQVDLTVHLSLSLMSLLHNPLLLLCAAASHLSWWQLASHSNSVWQCYSPVLTAQTAKYVHSH